MPWTPTRTEAEGLLKEAGTPTWVPSHCQCVCRLGQAFARLAERNGVDVDVERVTIGCILHDVGRAITQGARHGYLGADWLRAHEVDEAIVRIVETHVGAGLTPTAIQAIAPEAVGRDLIPTTAEEILVCHADNLHSASIRLTLEELRAKYRAKRLETEIERLEAMHEQVTAWIGQNPDHVERA